MTLQSLSLGKRANHASRYRHVCLNLGRQSSLIFELDPTRANKTRREWVWGDWRRDADFNGEKLRELLASADVEVVAPEATRSIGIKNNGLGIPGKCGSAIVCCRVHDGIAALIDVVLIEVNRNGP